MNHFCHAVFVLFCAAAACSAPPVDKTISGLITDAGSPLAGVTIRAGGPRPAETVSDSDGTWSFTIGERYSGTLEFSAPGYRFRPERLEIITLADNSRVTVEAVPVFEITQGTTDYEGASGAVALETGFYIAGTVTRSTETLSDFFVTGIDRHGRTQSSRFYGGPGNDYCNGAIGLRDGRILLFGSGDHENFPLVGRCFCIGPDGEILWQRDYGGNGWDTLNSAVPLGDGRIALAGSTTSQGPGIDGTVYPEHEGQTAWLLIIDESGTPLANRFFGGTGYDDFSGITFHNGKLLITGTTESFAVPEWGNGSDPWFVALDENLNELFSRPFNCGLTGRGAGIACSGERCFITGSLRDRDFLDKDIFVASLTLSGDLETLRRFSGEAFSDDTGKSVAVSPINTVVVAGTSVTSRGDTDFLALGYSLEIAEPAWVRCYGGVLNEEGNGIIPAPHGGYLFLGTTESSGAGREDAFVIKSDDRGIVSEAAND